MAPAPSSRASSAPARGAAPSGGVRGTTLRTAGGAGGPASDPALRAPLGVLHRQGDKWQALVIDASSGLRVVEARTFDTRDPAAAAGFFKRLKTGRVLRIMPASRSIGRLLQAPAGSDADVLAAVELLAEAELPSGLPSHRRAGGVVPLPASEGRHVAMLMGWTGEADEPALPSTEELWTTELAGLVGLGVLTGAGSLVMLDKQSGSLAVFTNGGGGPSLRSLRGDSSSPRAWRDCVAGATAEAALRAGSEPPEVPGESELATRRVWSGDAGVERLIGTLVQGVRADPSWLDAHAIGIGAAALFAQGGAPARSLFALRPDSRPLRQPLVRRTAHWLMQPRNAWTVIGASLALLLAGRLGLAWASAMILETRSGTLTAQQERQREVDRTVALYRDLQRNRWPMTKLLADLSSRLPVGVVIESIQITPGARGDSGSRFLIRGTAESPEQVARMRQNLAGNLVPEAAAASDQPEPSDDETGAETTADAGATPESAPSVASASSTARGSSRAPTMQVFKDVRVDRQEFDSQSKDGAVKFTVSGLVDNPILEVKPTEEFDFATRTLAQRLYGDAAGGGSSGSSASASSGEAGTDRASGGATSTAGGRDDGRAGARTGEVSAEDRAAAGERTRVGRSEQVEQAVEVPPPLTDEQIAALDSTKARDEFASRMKFSTARTTSDEDKARLKEEVAKLRDRLRALQSSGAASGTSPTPGSDGSTTESSENTTGGAGSATESEKPSDSTAAGGSAAETKAGDAPASEDKEGGA